MANIIIKKNGEENWLKLSGILTVDDFLVLQKLGKESIQRFGHFRILIELEDFQGWANDPAGWEATSFLVSENEKLSKIAFVGNEKWKVDIFMFIGQSMREMAIEFFPQTQIAQAQAWLSK